MPSLEFSISIGAIAWSLLSLTILPSPGETKSWLIEAKAECWGKTRVFRWEISASISSICLDRVAKASSNSQNLIESCWSVEELAWDISSWRLRILWISFQESISTLWNKNPENLHQPERWKPKPKEARVGEKTLCKETTWNKRQALPVPREKCCIIKINQKDRIKIGQGPPIEDNDNTSRTNDKKPLGRKPLG